MFVRKSAFVEAKQFDGSAWSAEELIKWSEGVVGSVGLTKASSTSSFASLRTGGTYLHVETPDGAKALHVGYWVTREANGTYYVYPPKMFEKMHRKSYPHDS